MCYSFSHTLTLACTHAYSYVHARQTHSLTTNYDLLAHFSLLLLYFILFLFPRLIPKWAYEICERDCVFLYNLSISVYSVYVEIARQNIYTQTKMNTEVAVLAAKKSKWYFSAQLLLFILLLVCLFLCYCCWTFRCRYRYSVLCLLLLLWLLLPCVVCHYSLIHCYDYYCCCFCCFFGDFDDEAHFSLRFDAHVPHLWSNVTCICVLRMIILIKKKHNNKRTRTNKILDN